MTKTEQLEIWENDSPGRDINAPEEWRPVNGFERYECSSLGRFRRGTAYLRGSPNANRYIHIGLKKEKNTPQEFRLAHRLIAETFIAKPITDKYLVVNHRNGIRGDNRVSNLEWATVAHNNREWRARR